MPGLLVLEGVYILPLVLDLCIHWECVESVGSISTCCHESERSSSRLWLSLTHTRLLWPLGLMICVCCGVFFVSDCRFVELLSCGVVHVRVWFVAILGVELEESNALSVCGSLFLNLHSGLASAANAKVGVHVLMDGFSNGFKLVTNVSETVSLSTNGFRLVSNMKYFSPCGSWFPGKDVSDSLSGVSLSCGNCFPGKGGTVSFPGGNFKWPEVLLFKISGEIPCVCQQCS